MSKENINNFGNILVYNPNSNTQKTTNMEDLSIYVDLEVETRDRLYALAYNTENKETITISYTPSKSEKVSFFKGSNLNGKNVLTDFYTDTTIETVTNNTIEGICIDNIDVNFDAWYKPEVSIRFVDVRGSGIFMNAQYIQDGGTLSEQFFSSFFSFPYPVYTLKLKGYYGEPVEYKLYCTDAKAEFDSSVGNFVFNVSFKGVTYAFLDDLDISYLRYAPYCKYEGESFWKSKSFKFDNGELIPTFDDLHKILQNVSINVDKITSQNELTKTIDEQSSALLKVTNILNKLKNITDVNLNINLGNEKNNISCFSNVVDNSFFFYGLKSLNDYSDQSIKMFIQDIYDEVKKIEPLKAYISSDFSYSPTYKDIYIYADKINLKKQSDYDSFLNQFNLSGYTISFSEMIKDENYFKKYMINMGNLKNKDKTDKGIKYIRCVDFSSLSKSLTNMIEGVSKSRNKNIEKINESIRSTVIEKIGFKPSINNFMKLLSAHLETFIHIMYKTVQDVGTERKLSKMNGLSVENTDNKLQDDTFYPFPALYMDENNVKTETWPSEKYIKPIIPETRLVYELTNAQMKVVSEQNINEMFTNEEKDFIPTDLFDYINNQSNPYDTLYTNNDSLEDVLLNICLRMFKTLSVNTNIQKLSREDFVKYLTQIAKIEGYNISSVFKQGKVRDIIYNKTLNYENILNILTTKLNVLLKDGELYELNLINNEFNVNNINIKQKFLPLEVNNLKYFKNITIDNKISFKNDKYVKSISVDESEYVNTMGNVKDESDYGSKVLEFVDENILNSYSNILKQKCKNNLNIEEVDNSLIKTLKVNSEYYLGLLDDNTNKNIGFISYDKSESSEYNDFENVIGCNIDAPSSIKVILKGIKKSDGLLRNYNKDILSVKEMVKYDNINYPLFRIDEFSISKQTQIHNYGSIFGSSLYYQQTDSYIKSYLFLNTLPINIKEFKNIFKQIENNNVLKLPKSVVLFIGGMYYRYDNDSKFNKDGYFFGKNSRKKFLKPVDSPFFSVFTYEHSKYESIPEEFFNIRKEIRDFFVNYFKDWTDSEYKENKYYVELDRKEKVGILYNLLENQNTTTGEVFSVISPRNRSQYKRISNKSVHSNVNNHYLLYMENRPSGVFTSFSLNIMKETLNIGSYGVFIREYNLTEFSSDNVYDNTFAKHFISGSRLNESKVKLYLSILLKTFREHASVESENMKAYETSYLNEINSDIIYASKYHYLKNIYDKWLSASNEQDYSDFYKNFNIIDRAYNKKAGDDCLIDFNKIIKFIYEMDQPLKVGSLIGKIMTENNFLYIPMSNLVFYDGINDIKNLFEPLPCDYTKSLPNKPSFLCMYVGKPSSVIDYGYGNKYRNDTYNIYDLENKERSNDLPGDFQKTDYRNENGDIIDNNYFMMVPAFLISVGNQNENYFKKVSVNMNEPSSTEQSLSAVYNLTNQSTGKKEGTGMDLYNIYSKRSFKCEVEMMGNAQIQPFMYFQLTNIPMWNGTYLIYKIRHNISAGRFNTFITGMKVQKSYPYFDNQGFASGVNFYKNESVGLLDNYNLTREVDDHIVIVNNDGKAAGLKIKNPFNIRKGEEWVGKKDIARIGTGLFVEFVDVKYGVRAAFVTLKTYMDKYNINTINGIINRWAPKNENETERYISFIESETGINRNKTLTFGKEEFYPIARAMAKQETGYKITNNELDSGWNIMNITSTNYG